MNITSLNLFFPLATLIFSVFIRLNFWPFTQTFGLYQGDWWYFHHNYGAYIANNFFYPIEYPVGYIIIQKVAFIISLFLGGFTYENFILANALIFIPVGLSIFILLQKLGETIGIKSKRFILYLSLSPTFFIASTTNYDLLPVSLTLLAMLLLITKRPNLAFLALALGTIVKIYPIFLLPLFILYLLGKKSIFLPILIFITTVVGINLPFMIYDFHSWIFPYTWQLQNPQAYDFNTISYYLTYLHLDHYRNFLALGLLMIAWIISLHFYLKKRLTNKNFLLFCYFIIFTTVFGNHVNTPQYMLWFLPFAALLQIPSLLILWPIDFINASVLFSYFKLHYNFQSILAFVFHLQVLSFTFIYLYLIYNLKKHYEKD